MFANRLVPLLGAAGVAALLAACSSDGSATTAGTATPRTNAAMSGAANSAAGLQRQYESTVKAVLPSVVLIQTSADLGSGIVFDRQGDIVTNAHVVGTARRFTVNVTGSVHSMSASLVGTYPPDDLAVIRVSDASGLRPARFGNSSNVKVGEIVLAMGNPLGLASSVTNGIVSAIGRTVTEPTGDGSPGATLPDAIQTSAAINPGNSGGALVDLADKVIGIPTLAATDQQEGGAAPGIGFAISSNVVKDVATQLVAHGRVLVSHRAALGARVATVTGGSGQDAGAGIVSVQSGSAAAIAELQPGDVITNLAGTRTPSAEALAQVLANLRPGQLVGVTVDRSATDMTVQVRLGALAG